MKVAGHRVSTAEIENAITQHPAIVECAVVAAPHEIKGEAPVAFIILKPGYNYTPELETELRKYIDKMIGPIARPEKVILIEDLPKTRSGKIMRRILKSLIKNAPVGDITTLQNPESVQAIKERVGYKEPA
jgi:acetyl-CoA synthetase